MRRGRAERGQYRGGLGLSVVAVSALVALLGLRADLASKLRDPVYLRESGALLLSFVFAGSSTFRLATPGLGESRALRLLPSFALLSWLALVGLRYPAPVDSGAASEAAGWACVWRMLALSFVPGAALFGMLRQGAVFTRAWAASLVVLASAALAMLGTQAICAKDGAHHVLLWHCVPLAAAVFSGAVLGRTLFSSSR